MKDKPKKGIGLQFALNGLIEAWKRERNFRIHVTVAVFVIAAGIYFHVSFMEWAILIIMIHIVIMTELLNSIIERLIDYLQPEWHPKAKIIKDMAAAIVLVSAAASIIVGLFIFLPKLM